MNSNNGLVGRAPGYEIDDCKEESDTAYITSVQSYIYTIKKSCRIIDLSVTLDPQAAAGTYYVVICNGMDAYDLTSQAFKSGADIKFPYKAIQPGQTVSFAALTKWPKCDGLTVAISSGANFAFSQASVPFMFYYHVIYDY